MSFSTRLSNGWKLAKVSFQVLNSNKQLVLFPILSSIALIVIIGSFVGAMFGMGIFDSFRDESNGKVVVYGVLFLVYIVNYFVVVFFNTALIHCVDLYLNGEKNISLNEGLKFSTSRIGVIFAWAAFAATVGLILKIIQENTGTIGKIITGIIGLVWNIATFFVVPVIAYENLTPIAAIKRSSQMMKEKWGESLAGNFSFGIVQLVLILCAGLVSVLIGSLIHPVVGIAVGVILAFLIFAVISAAQTVFTAAVYRNINGSLDEHFDQQLIDNLFEPKKKKSIF